MKRSVKIILLMILLFICSSTLFACTSQGASAYDIAVANGFVGTEVEWLESLKGADGNDGQDGFNGENGKDGKNATTVSSLYEDAVINGYEGAFWDFVNDYVKGDNGEHSVVVATNKAITSVVSVNCTFTKRVYSIDVDYNTSGSGVIFELNKEDGNAYIITNYHVVYSKEPINLNRISNRIKVKLYGSEFDDYAIDAVCIGGSMTYDIAVLKVTSSEVLKESSATVAECNLGTIHAGDVAIAIGNPSSDGISVSSGIVSVDSEYIKMTAADDYTEMTYRVIRIDAAVNGGNSGGGLFDKNGKLIGIVNAKNISTYVDNIGYALPIGEAIRIAKNIKRNYNGSNFARAQIANLGISTEIQESKALYDINTTKIEILQIIKISTVETNSYASYYEFMVGDVLKSIEYNGQVFDISRDYVWRDLLLEVLPGSELKFKILRNGEEIEKTVVFIALNSVQ